MVEQKNYWSKFFQRQLTRRRALQTAAGAGMSLVGLLACAAPAPSPTSAPASPAAPGGTPRPGVTPTPTVATPVSGGTLKVAQVGMTTLDAHVGSGGSLAWQLVNLYNALTTYDPVAKPIPDLAESWEIPDSRTIIFKLRKGVKFHDGADFNAQAVKFSYDRVMDPNTKSTARSRVAEIVKSYEVMDDYTFKFNLGSPSASFLSTVTSAGSGVQPGYVVSPEAAKKLNNDLTQQGVGTGPFQASEWRMDDHITFKKFPGYWEKGFPYLDQITWQIIPDATVQMTMLKTGDVHFVTEGQTKDIAAVRADPALVPIVQMSVGYIGMYMNQRKPPFDKKALRLALAYAIDREAIAKAVFFDVHPAMQGLFSPAMWAYDPTIKGHPFDPAKAKEKLKEGGAPDGYAFTAIIASGRPEHLQSAEAMKEMLSKVGIKMTLQMVEREAASDMYVRGQVQGWLGQASSSPEPHRAVIDRFYSKGTRGPANIDPEDPDAKAIDALIERGDSTYDLESRKAVYSQLQKALLDNNFIFYGLVWRAVSQVRRKEVMGYAPSADSVVTFFKKTWLQK
ncbi:MAG: hypothetical protein HYU86_10885 [Chloroflexi bacterium]|nr:hypothetical protein [Chloroflexota bacterium]